MFFFDNGLDSKRTIGIRDKQILYRNSKGRCQNPGCNKKIEFDEMQVGHKTAWSKGGSTTLRNSVCICYRCNKLQGTDSWATFMKKQGIKDPKTDMKATLETLTITQLKLLAGKHHIRVTGQVVETMFDSHRKAPTKRQYINKLSGVVTNADLHSVSEKSKKKLPKTTKRLIPTKKRKKEKPMWDTLF
ncbi:MAG: HNH endonuclease [Chloroflexi bacterium]|nr:HNH endonuclease [Chloroflexota bacterium]